MKPLIQHRPVDPSVIWISAVCVVRRHHGLRGGGSILYDRQDLRSGFFGIWLHDVARGTDVRVTAATEAGRFPLWLLDGTNMAFASYTPRGVATKQVGAASPTTVLDTEARMGGTGARPVALSSDGRFLFAERIDPKTKSDIWIYPMSPGPARSGDPIPYLSEESNEQYPAPSPNNRWVAYVSDESGRREVYAQTFPRPTGKWQVSSGGGGYPVWGRDGYAVRDHSHDPAEERRHVEHDRGCKTGSKELKRLVPTK